MEAPHLRRQGRFKISHDLFHDNLAIVHEILKGCIVFEATSHYLQNEIEYVAIHAQFDELALGESPPLYVAEMDTELYHSGLGSSLVYKFAGWRRVT